MKRTRDYSNSNKRRTIDRGGNAVVRSDQDSLSLWTASGHTHQGNPTYSGENAQCVAMAACASIYSVQKHRENLTSSDIDYILESGDTLYMQRKPFLPVNVKYLEPEDLPTEICVGGNLTQIERMGDNWIANGLFPQSKQLKDYSLLTLANLIEHGVFNSTHNDNTDSILFTGQDYTVSFWRFNNVYYLFNSHAVDEHNKPNGEAGVARLFKCDTVEKLAGLLFARDIFGEYQYSLHRLRVNNYIPKQLYSSVVSNEFNSPSLLQGTQLPPALLLLETNNMSPTTNNSKKAQSINKNDLNSVVSPFACNEIIGSIQSPSILGECYKAPVVSLDKKKTLAIASTTLNTTQISNAQKKILQSDVKSKMGTNDTSDIKLYLLKPVVVLQNMFSGLTVDYIDTEESSKKRGRPKKQIRGKRQTKYNAHLDAVKKYTENNPHVNRKAVKKYIERNPDMNRDAVDRYAKQNPEMNKNATKKYNANSRNLDVPLRKSSNLIGQMRGNDLNAINTYSLKKKSLLATDIFNCQNCGARLFEEEKSRKQWCCGSGAYNIQNLTPLTEEFYSHPSFVNRPRAYNNLFAFSALGVSHGYKQPDGLSFLKIQGRVYHRVFDLAYADSMNNLGLYINDSDEREQLAIGQNLDIQVIRSIKNLLYNVNPYIECFKRLSQEPSDEAFIQFQKTSRETHGNILGDLPIGREVAAIISTERETFVPRCVAIWKIGAKKPHTVDIMNPVYESFQYPLLYPQGDAGWYPNKVDNNGKKLAQVKYVRCLLLSESRFSQIGRLSEEWLVDMYCRIAEERLRFLSSLQKHNSNNALRSAPLQEVEMNIEFTHQVLQDETIQGEGFVPGRVYLPSSFTGGPRYMKGKYSDAIAIVSRLGNPSFFLTFTCNPKWPEIQQSDMPGRGVNPLVCARVFNLKLLEIVRDIRSGRWFGKCIYMMHVIEFQKRGLPHAHICFRVEGGGPVQNADIDKFVRADIPDESEAEGRLQKAVLSHMIHGPCGPPHRTNLPCWNSEKRKCSKFFPKRDTPTTFCDDKGFVNLRRNIKNEVVIKYRGQEITINDTWVVPYNASLLLKYDAHINLEVSSQRTVVKYLFKYITKGPDESRVAVVSEEDKNNEIEQYITKRYIGSSDAAWRTLEFDVTAREPNVKQLSVHLENQQAVYFRPGTEADAARRANSDLMTYFNRPVDEEFESLTYLDFYEQYIVHAKRPSTKNTEIFETTNNKFITKRQRGELVARLFWVAPNRGEQFYLRLLLKTYPCRNYTDLKSLGGPNCLTFQEAAKVVGLANDEVEYEKAMWEASTFFTGPRLRSFFVLLAVNGAPVASLWEKFKTQLSEDISHRTDNEDEEEVHTLCLIDINRMLRKHGSTLAQHGLPEVVDNTTELGRELVEHNCDTLVNYVNEWLPRLSLDQRTVFDHVAKLCDDNNFRETSDTAIFIDGPAGTGKTLVLNVIAAHVRGILKGVVLCTASSAIAAQNYDGGSTAHSMFKFPIDIVDDLGYWNITNGSQRAELIYHANIIIYDEAPMAHKYLIHLLDRSLRDLMKNEKKIGGKIIIFAGDFRQIPPVVINARTNSDILNASVKTSPIWQKLKCFALVTSQRCKEDEEFAKFILDLGSNKLTSQAIKVGGHTQNMVDLSSIEMVSELEELIEFVFPFVDEPVACIYRSILATRNDAVREINNIILEKLSGDTLHFYSIDTIENVGADELFLGPDALNRMQPRGVPEHDLKLKIGCICMIMRNLSFNDGLVNGTKVIVTATSPRLITVQKSYSTDPYLIPRITIKTPIDSNSPFEMSRHQFPLQLCYATTIHKSQGKTLSRVGLDLRSDVFSHGQLYVALGRVTNKNHLKILMHKDRILDGKPYGNNVIIPELL